MVPIVPLKISFHFISSVIGERIRTLSDWFEAVPPNRFISDYLLFSAQLIFFRRCSAVFTHTLRHKNKQSWVLHPVPNNPSGKNFSSFPRHLFLFHVILFLAFSGNTSQMPLIKVLVSGQLFPQFRCIIHCDAPHI